MLMAGGALGALGALSATAPAQARSTWSWSPAGSVAGSGQGLDPRWVWDEEADPLVASLLDRGDVPLVNRLLRTWTKNGQPLPAGLPADVHQFIERARLLKHMFGGAMRQAGASSESMTSFSRRGIEAFGAQRVRV